MLEFVFYWWIRKRITQSGVPRDDVNRLTGLVIGAGVLGIVAGVLLGRASGADYWGYLFSLVGNLLCAGLAYRLLLGDSYFLKIGSQLTFIAAAAAGVFAFVRAAQHDARRASCTALCKLHPAYAGYEKMAPDFELTDMNGHKVRLSDFRGKTVFLNFWTKTCAPCLEEMPSIAELARVAKGRKDLVVLTVSTDEGPNEVRDTLKVALGADVPFPVLFDPEGQIVNGRYGTRLFPETWIIDPSGVIRARFDGARDWSSSLAVEIGETIKTPGACPVEFMKGMPRGPHAGICDDDS